MSKVESQIHIGNTEEQGLEKALSSSERELLIEILGALRVMRYGSIVLTVHDGRIVEVQKTERIRRSAGKQG